jgi:dihydropteroate synthase
MGVLNITPDSFSDGGYLFIDGKVLREKVMSTAQRMLDEGATVLDVGGESSRPGAKKITVEEELHRIMPVVEALSSLDCIVSVDTRNGETARAAIQAGAHMINDIGAGGDHSLLDAVAESGSAYALMHMQGLPQTMQENPSYREIVSEVGDFLHARYQRCLALNINAKRLLIDPGFGFGKSLEHNLKLLKHLDSLRIDNCSILVGISRKSMLGEITQRAVEARSAASVAAALLAVQNGANIVRAHDIRETVDALKVWSALETIE